MVSKFYGYVLERQGQVKGDFGKGGRG